MNFPNAKMVPNTEGVEALCVNTGMISELCPFMLNATEMKALGLTPHAKIKAGDWWRVEDVPAMMEKLFDAARGKLGMPTLASLPTPTVSVRIVEHATPEELAAARAAYASDDIQIDDNAEVSRGDDVVWVAAWVCLEVTPD